MTTEPAGANPGGSIDNPVAPPRKGRPSWFVALPFLVFLLLAGLWSAAWFYLAGRADAELERRLQMEAAAGHALSCAERKTSGYPFRFEVICDKPVLHLARQDLTLSAARLHAEMQIYDPSLIIFEVAGPVTARPGIGESLTARFRLAQASYRGTPEAMTRAALVLDDLSVTESSGDGSTAARDVASAKRLELHLRPTPDVPAGSRDLDLAVSASQFAAPGLPPSRVDLQATAFALPESLARNVEALLRRWQADGGRLGISELRFESGRFLARAQGSLSLDASGRLDGQIAADVAGLDKVPAATGPWGVLAGAAAALAVTARPARVEDRSGLALRLKLEKGALRLGPLRLASVPPLF